MSDGLPPLGEPLAAPRRLPGGRSPAALAVGALVVGVVLGVVGALALTDADGGDLAPGSTTTTAGTADQTTPSTLVERGRRQCIVALDDAATAIDLVEVGVESVQDLDAESLRAVIEQLRPMTPSLRASLEECRDSLVD